MVEKSFLSTRRVLRIALITGFAQIFIGCGYSPESVHRPEFSTASWAELRGESDFVISESLASTLDEEGLPTLLRLSGRLYYVGTRLDDSGAARVESFMRMLRGWQSDEILEVRKLNQLVYGEKEYRFLKLSVAFWRERKGTGGGTPGGLYLLQPGPATPTVRQLTKRYEFLRADPAMTWEPIQPIEDASSRLDAMGAESTKSRLVGRLALRREGDCNRYIAANTGTGVDFQIVLPPDVLREILEEDAAVFAEIRLGHEFREGVRDEAPSTRLRGTLAVRNPRLDSGGRLLSSSDNPPRDRIYGDRILSSDLKLLLAHRKSLLETLASLLSDGKQGGQEWKSHLGALRGMQRDLGAVLAEASPPELAYLMPSVQAIEEPAAGEFVGDESVAIVMMPDGRSIEVKTGDVAIRLGTSRQIAIGTFPLPRATYGEDGLVDSLQSPGTRDGFRLFRAFLSDPEVQPYVKKALTPVWEKIDVAIRQKIDLPGPREEHPFLTMPGAERIFLTALDQFISNQIEREIVFTDVDDEWQTVQDREFWPSIIDKEGETEVTIELEDVKEMRGADVEDLLEAVDARKKIPAYASLPSPFDLDITNAQSLADGIPYWPGTPFLSHVGIIVVERVDGRTQAFVYDAYPGEGIMRKSFARFFAPPEAAMGALFRLADANSKAPREAARDIVTLYELRRRTKRLRVRPTQSGTPEVEVLLDASGGPPDSRAQAWDSFDYAFDWRNQTRYSCSELIWSHYARQGIQLADSFSMLLAPITVAQNMLGWGVEVMVQASPQCLVLSDKLIRVADFDSEIIGAAFESYSASGEVQRLTADVITRSVEGQEVPTIWIR